MSISDNPPRLKSSIIASPHNANMPWPPRQLRSAGRHSNVIDEDLGLSGSGVVERSGFARLTAEVALRHVGIVLGLEVSRLARNNADWYRLLDLCGLTDTLIGDADGVYHPAMFNDRLLLGLKGTMSEAELHVLRARLLGGIRNKAARGELRRGLPVGFVWGEETPATSPSIMCLRIRSTRAPTRMARAAMRSLLMPPAHVRSAYASCRGRNGLCSFRTTTKASSIGAHTRAIACASRPTLIRDRINQVAVP
jgi:DNA invertase Pin-like site-specific DNA recombinase